MYWLTVFLIIYIGSLLWCYKILPKALNTLTKDEQANLFNFFTKEGAVYIIAWIPVINTAAAISATNTIIKEMLLKRKLNRTFKKIQKQNPNPEVKKAMQNLIDIVNKSE